MPLETVLLGTALHNRRVAVTGNTLKDYPTFTMEWFVSSCSWDYEIENMESTEDSCPALELRERRIVLLLSVVS